MRFFTVLTLVAVAVAEALPAAQEPCSAATYPCGSTTLHNYGCCVPLVCGSDLVCHHASDFD